MRVTTQRLGWIAAGLLLVTLAAGCETTGRPNWLHPGPAAVQQQRAVQYDPYPESEPGGSMAGTRPPSYEKPLPEIDRARWLKQGESTSYRWLPWNWGR